METNLSTYLHYTHILLLTTNVTYHNVHSFQDLINKIVSFGSNMIALKHHHVHKVADGKIITPQFRTCSNSQGGGHSYLTFAPGQLENLVFFIENILGTLHFTDSENRASFNFS